MLSPNMADDLYEFGQTLSMFKELVMPRFLILSAHAQYEYGGAEAYLSIEAVDFDGLIAWVAAYNADPYRRASEQVFEARYRKWAKTARVGDRIGGPDLGSGRSGGECMFLAVPDDWPDDYKEDSVR